ncbi:hypothetical protein L596_016429 [Steinernema carpocapsae]|uniref:Uncharacterized protein n=1 Tax=Steinernema carpocapsae TaxID=34508 RepID=A0A4U5NHY6_STECR|nr:hypothetical protein L596_016429 [Steinernema carpocapsae]
MICAPNLTPKELILTAFRKASWPTGMASSPPDFRCPRQRLQLEKLPSKDDRPDDRIASPTTPPESGRIPAEERLASRRDSPELAPQEGPNRKNHQKDHGLMEDAKE